MVPMKLLMLGALSISVINILLIKYVKKRYNKKKALLNAPKPFYYNFVFTSNNIKCVRHVHENIICGDKCSNFYLNLILDALSSAKKSISLCMYHLTLESVSKVIADAYKRGVKVRVITDKEMSFATGSQIKHLRNNGIQVKTPSQNVGLLHHKFCLVDENTAKDAVLLFGSMNYTIQGLCNNWDNIMFTNDFNILKRFSEGFEDLWENYC